MKYEPPNYQEEMYEAKAEQCESYRKAAEFHRTTLRDQFAMHCPITITEFMNAHTTEYGADAHEDLEHYAQFRYEYADCMLAAREEQ